jgi:hypothetical protein
LTRSGCQEARSQKRLKGRDATGCDADTHFDGGPNREISRAVEEIAFVWLECGRIRKTNDGCGGATAWVRKEEMGRDVSWAELT